MRHCRGIRGRISSINRKSFIASRVYKKFDPAHCEIDKATTMSKHKGWMTEAIDEPLNLPQVEQPSPTGTIPWPDRVDRTTELNARLIKDRMSETQRELNVLLPPGGKILSISVLTGSPNPDPGMHAERLLTGDGIDDILIVTEAELFAEADELARDDWAEK
jgi:hypothetical protein